MDWKTFAVVFVVVGLAIFFFIRQCGKPEPGAQRADTQAAARAPTADRQASRVDTAERTKLQEEARQARGPRQAEETVTLETSDFAAVFTTRGASLRSFTLKDSQYFEPPRDWSTGKRDEETDRRVPVNLVTTNPDLYEQNNPLRLEIVEGLPALLPDADYRIIEKTADRVVFRYEQPGLPVVITKKFEVDRDSGPNQIWLTARVTNIGTTRLRFRAAVTQQGYQHSSETGGGWFSTPPNLQKGICRYGDTTFRAQATQMDAPFTGVGVSFTGVEDNYFVAAMIPGDDVPTSCSVYPIVPAGDASWAMIRAELRFGESEIDPGESVTFRVKNYLGPKKYSVLRSVGHGLATAVDFGMFWPICKVLLWLLLAFQSVVVNWGVAIILLTVVVKAVLTPLTHRSFISAERMRQLKPELDAINVKHKDDAQAKQKAMMDLYKQHGVNPLGGCLPTLLQMPIWIALYSTLRTAPELFRAHFFGWIRDLSAPDPYFVTPIVMGVLMFLQQRMTPTTGDQTQAKMMLYIMPPMFTAMMLFLPSGLTLYILVSTLLSILHQTYVHRRSPVFAARRAATARKG